MEATPSSTAATRPQCQAGSSDEQAQTVPILSMLDHSGSRKLAILISRQVWTSIPILCSGFYSASDVDSAEDQSLFVCERKMFNSLCTGLTKTCQCQANALQITKTIQVQL